jgi:hypothetical protein
MADVEDAKMDVDGDGVSPKNDAPIEQAIQQPFGAVNNRIGSLDLRADPDAQATVTDFLDFTEYLPSDMVRSLTLIGKLDQTYIDASHNLDDLTTTWGKLPTLTGDYRPTPKRLRADISRNLNRALSSRAYAHAEATRMTDNVNRHYNRAKTILSKLQTMLKNYPENEEPKSPVASKSPQLVRAPKVTLRIGEGGPKVRRQRVPRITVPGEVLAPYELDYDVYSDESDESSSESESDTPPRATPAPRIRLVQKGQRVPKAERPPKASRVPVPHHSHPVVAPLPPPEDAEIGGPHLPWLALSDYELNRLRKRMKKNPAWEPSTSMILRELETLGRGPTAFKAAKKKAQDEGQNFEAKLPEPNVDPRTGEKGYPIGALSEEALEAEGISQPNRGMKLNVYKKQKKELAKLAAEEAEESARKMAEAAKLFMNGHSGSTPSIAGSAADVAKDTPKTASKSKSKTKPNSNKRKRESVTDVETIKPEGEDSPPMRPQAKRTKTETPVPPPNLNAASTVSEKPHTETPIHPPQLTPAGTVVKSTTPVPIPHHSQSQEPTIVAAPRTAATSPTGSTAGVTTTTVPTKPAAETHIPPPILSPKKSTTPILPPVRETIKRETRGDAAKKTQQQTEQPAPSAPLVALPVSRGATPRTTTPAPEVQVLRPRSRGKAMSQEPQPSLAADRPRRASTARNTPAPEVRQPSKRAKRPAPGVVSTTNAGRSSAVGKRKAAPKRKARAAQKKDKVQPAETEMEEVDDDGNPIDPDEPRYCLCNRVSFGEMIECDSDVSFAICRAQCNVNTN